MFTKKNLVFPVSKPKGIMYLREVLEYENSFLEFLEGNTQPIDAAYAIYVSRIKAGASLAEVEGLAQVIQYIESLPAAKQKNFMHTIHTELESALYNVKIVPDETTFFYKDGTIQTVDIIGSLTSKNYAALNGTPLIKVIIGQHITTIGVNAFYSCTSLASVTIPNSVTVIEAFAFNNCSALASINIPNSVKEIGDSAFSSCISLVSITIPDSVNAIGEWVFYNCPSLISATLSNNMEEIGNYLFNNCISLTSIIVPSSVKAIKACAFCGCTSLASIDIPNSVTEIERDAFANISHIYYKGNATGAPWGAKSIN